MGKKPELAVPYDSPYKIGSCLINFLLLFRDLIPKQAGQIDMGTSSVSAALAVGRVRSRDPFFDNFSFFGSQKKYQRFAVNSQPLLLFFAAFCLTLTVIVWFGRTASTSTIVVITAICMMCFSVSVIAEARQRARLVCGVITAQEVTARQGDGQNYPASFKEPLHEGTEFDVIEHRPGWLHIRLSDNNDGWIPNNTAELI